MKRILAFLLGTLIASPAYAVWTAHNKTDGSFTITDTFNGVDAISIDSAGDMVFGGYLDVNGETSGVILDADADTSISAPTDDQIDIALKSVDHLVLKAVATADSATTTNIAELAFTTPVDTTGTNTHQGLVIDAEIGNSSGGTNTVNLLETDAITGDAQVTLNAINIGALTGTAATETAINVASGWDKVLNASWTSSSTDGGTSVESMVVDQTMTGAGGVGGRARFQLNANAALGGWANALKGITDFSSSGSVTGLGSAVLAELNLSTGTTSGTYAPLETELTLDSGASTGTATSFWYANVSDDNATFNTNGYLFELGSGVVDTASGVFDANAKAGIGMTHTLRIRVGGTTYYLPLHTSANFGGS